MFVHAQNYINLRALSIFENNINKIAFKHLPAVHNELQFLVSFNVYKWEVV